MADELDPNERGMLEHWRPMQPPADFVDRLVTARLVRRRLVPAAIAASMVACAAIAFVIMRPRSDKPSQVVAVVPTDAPQPGAELVSDASAYVIIDAHINELAPPVTVTNDIDLVLPAGERVTIHDPRGETTIRVAFDGRCPDRGIVEYDKEPNFFRNPLASAGRGAADILLGRGAWSYRVICDGSPVIVAKGGVIVTKDSGARPLPKLPAINPISADGRTYRISYQGLIPDLKIELGRSGTLHLASTSRHDTFVATETSVLVPGTKLSEGTYTYWVGDDPKNVSTLIVVFDQTTPQVFIDAPKDRAGAFAPEVEVRGLVLPGWTAKVDVVELPITGGRFMAKVPAPTTTRALVLRFAHPQRGIHYYLRRP